MLPTYKNNKQIDCQKLQKGKRPGSWLAIVTLAFLSFALSFGSCKKLIDISPPATAVTGASVYSSDATATAVLTGLYTQISGTSYATTGFPTISLFAGLSADELTLWSGVSNTIQIAYYRNYLSANPSAGSEMWYTCYPYIFICNLAIEGLNLATALTPAVKQQLIGEAKFMRALFYFYLVNFYGDVPIVLSSDYKANATLARAPKGQVWEQIIADLIDAQGLLSMNYLKADARGTTTERVRPTKWAATALLARAYLYTSDWMNAEAQSTIVINNSSLYSLNSLNNVFLKNSSEAIWQLQPVTSGITNTQDAYFFIIPSTGLSSSWPVYLSNSLLNSFEAGDQRRINWVGKYTDTTTNPHRDYFYPFKYKVNTLNAAVTEYLMMLRLGEQYLIRAEARAQQNNINSAQSDLNAIRVRAGLLSTAANDKTSLLTAILHERQMELFTEFGQRWLDLKRTGNVDAVMSAVMPSKANGAIWQSYQQLYPLPLADIQKDPNLAQTSGY